MFKNDYSEVAAEAVLQSLLQAQTEQNAGYGMDGHCARAKEYILRSFGLDAERADVHFLVGGTQTNMTVISYFLRPYEGVICCDTGHIHVHETAAVEASGHKILTCPNRDGKLLPEDVERTVKLHSDEHMVKPAMVYISQSTETGTIYTAQELLALRKVCDRYGLLLFLDGARLAVALTAPANDVSAELIGALCDVFYVGGTKNGLLFGEAVVIRDKRKAPLFRYHIKNRGAMTAKGFILGIQFETLFEDGLYFRLAENSNRTAAYIRRELFKLGVPLEGNSCTNQIFIRLPADQADALIARYGCEPWADYGAEKTIRIVTSFATSMAECAELADYVQSIL